MQIAIDGPSSSGKSTIAKRLAQKYHFTYLDTGAMYRVITLYALEHEIDINDQESLSLALEDIKISFQTGAKGQAVFLNGKDVTHTIRNNEVTNAVSAVSAHKSIRQEMVRRQREIAEQESIIMDGRDIGTVVLPNADIKIFLIASAEVRAMRRYKENLDKHIESSYEQILEDLKRRDYLDSTRTESPLKKADDAIELDSSHLTIEEVVDKISELIEEVMK